LARMHLGLQDCLYLGNLEARRDWGHARDYVQAQWLMLQQDKPEDFVIATGEQHSVREFVECDARVLGIRIEWRGAGIDAHGLVADAPGDSALRPGQRIVAIDPRYHRPAEVETLLGDASKARAQLGWSPTIPFEDLVTEMMEADLALARRDTLVGESGYQVPRHHECTPCTPIRGSTSPGIAAWWDPPSSAACAPVASAISCSATGRIWICRTRPGWNRSSGRSDRSTCFLRPPRQGESTPTSPTLPSSSTRTW